jgi:hypothetical protein
MELFTTLDFVKKPACSPTTAGVIFVLKARWGILATIRRLPPAFDHSRLPSRHGDFGQDTGGVSPGKLRTKL